MLVFPTPLFKPSSLRATLLGAATTGGRSIGGIQQLGQFSGGGLWSIEFGEVNLWNRENMLTWRAFEAACQNGATSIIVPLGNRIHQPITAKAPGTVAFSDDGLWDDGTPFVPLEVDAVTTADAALRATQITFDYTADKPLIGGEHLSFLHAGKGWRMYRNTRVRSGGAGTGDSTTIDILPPLRAAVASGTPLNLESPRCVCRLVDDASAVLDMMRLGSAQGVRFIESFPPVLE